MPAFIEMHRDLIELESKVDKGSTVSRFLLQYRIPMVKCFCGRKLALYDLARRRQRHLGNDF
jgi:hypothetical protein